MNKKKLSVVMAGAMLASSVSPVLAATESEVDSSQLGSLVVNVYDKLVAAKKFDEKVETANDVDVFDSRVNLAGKSVYYVVIKGANGSTSTAQKTAMRKIYESTEEGKEAELKDALQEAFKDLSAGDVVEIHSFGYRTNDDDKIVSTSEAKYASYTLADFTGRKVSSSGADGDKIKEEIENTLKSESCTALNTTSVDISKVSEGKITITFPADVKFNKMPEGYVVEESATAPKLTLRVGDDKLDFAKFIKADGDSENISSTNVSVANVVHGFPKAAAIENSASITNELIETIKVTGTTYNYKTTDLYDGLMLTTEGHNLLSAVKEARKSKNTTTKAVIKNVDGSEYAKKTDITNLKKDASGNYAFTLEITDSFNKTTVYTVSGAEKQTEVLASWLNNELAKVDILAGDNRYETAVQIAKEQAHVSDITTTEIDNIVLVNGNSLVDGLSASSLASYIKAGDNGNAANAAAPILLTEADSLPKATKEYLRELMNGHTVGSLGVTIHLVGGKTVLSKSLEKELKSLGFSVERYAGDNREETSLAVAEEIGTTNGAFVVGADGEADAMSIAGVAATKEAPIIVAKRGGLTDDALEALEGAKVIVIGGELSVSAEEYAALKEVTADTTTGALRRIAGENRQATNAAIIKEFYHGTGVKTPESVIVAKDGKGNKTELVDALTAANLAAQTNAPVVLAKSSLTDAQIDALNLRAKSADSLYQVGIGVERSVVETIASNLGLLNK